MVVKARQPPAGCPDRKAPACAVAVFAAVAASAAAQADGDEWCRFRGPNGSGIGAAATVPARWTEKDYNWKVKLPGGGHSSPVVWKDRLFLLCADAETAARMVVCLRVGDGQVVWRRDYASTPHKVVSGNTHASSTPAVGADGVYATWTAPEEVTLAALTPDGEEKWRRNLGPYANRFGGGTSPILVGEVVILACEQTREGFLIAVDRATGKTRWRIDRRMRLPSWATPCLCRRGGAVDVVFASSACGLVGIDPKTGQTTWQAGGAVPDRVAASPIVAGGLVVGACGKDTGGVQVDVVRPPAGPAAGEAKRVYTYRKPDVPYVPTPLARGNRLFLWADDGTITCLRLDSGRQVWSAGVGGRFHGSPVCVGDRLYCVSTDGVVVVVAAGDEFKLLARNALGEGTSATPAVADGVMYLRTRTHLISIGGKRRDG